MELEIGAFSGVEPELLQFAFSIIKKNTILEDSEIKINVPPLILFCNNCETDYLGDLEDLRCPVCLGEDFKVHQGRELRVKSIVGG